MHEPVDPGLQPERTTLAWSRTLMAYVIVAAFFLRWAGEHGVVVVVLFGAAIAVALAIGATQRTRHTAYSRAIGRNSAEPNAGPAVALSASVVLLGAAGLVVISL
ncbi:DUF202 domain-containing protein [Kocuria sp. ZOR0020]|uniref:DUF202 domain-containing protein n=1 Tax=Kocuria sp. ZOR0020 TaxID=1339234 RepID=UPI000AA4C6CE|nr:DUF202 domain-containing protein [Kocuria sp. ZOR0020]